MKKIKIKEKMIRKITITLSVFIMFFQPVNADEKQISSLSKKFNLFLECINQEIEDSKDFQIKMWKEAKHKNSENFETAKHKLSGFFSDFPELDKK